MARKAPDTDLQQALAGAEILIGSINDEPVLREAVNGSDHVVHAVGCPFPAESTKDPVGDLGHTIPGLVSLLETIRQNPEPRLTYISSGGTVYGNAGTGLLSEDTPTHPVTAYGITKLTAERFIGMYSELYGVRANVLRVANAYGPRQTADRGQGVIAALVTAALRSTPIKMFGDGSLVRDYVHVDDIAKAVMMLYGVQSPTVTVNVGAGRGYTIAEVLAMVQDIHGSPLRVEQLPDRPFDVRHVVLDITRLRSLIPWSPMDLDAGIKSVYAEWQRNRDPATVVPGVL
jgi:UDP-glucose 4-epimerase